MSEPHRKPLTVTDIRMLEYFFVGKGDITCWTDWDARHEQVKSQLPEVYTKMRLVEAAMAIAAHLTLEVDALLKQAEDRART